MVANLYRPLSEREKRLASWMLRNGNPDAAQFLQQLEDAEATNWRCQCGCASYNFKVRDLPKAPPGTHILGDFLFFDGTDLAGVFIFSSDGILSGVEVFGMAADAPKELPEPEALMTYEAYGRDFQSKN